MGPASASAPGMAAGKTRLSPLRSCSVGAGPGSVVARAGSVTSLEVGALGGEDVRSGRASALRKAPKGHQGKWGEGLGVPLPMLRRGVPGVQRG